MNRWLLTLFVTVIVATGSAAAAQADLTPTPEASGDDAGSGGGIKWFTDALTNFLLTPVEWTINKLSVVRSPLFADHPDVTKQWIRDVHEKVFAVALALATVAIVWIGVLHITNQVDGVRPIVAIFAALVIGAVAPDLLSYPVRLAELTTRALLPTEPLFEASIEFGLNMAVIAMLDMSFLLGLAFVFLGRNMFLILGVVLAPLIALLAVTPGFRQPAKMLASTWTACLLLGPFDAVLLHVLLRMMEGQTNLPEWLWALTGHLMLLGLPLAVLSVGVVVMGPGLSLVRRTPGRTLQITDRIRNWRQDNSGHHDNGGRDLGRGSRSPRDGGRGNRFDWRDDDD